MSENMRGGFTAITCLFFLLGACGKKDGGTAAPQASLSASGAAATTAGDAAAAQPNVAVDPWTAAASLEAEDLSRLALREGSVGLVAGATDPTRRKIAVLALAFADDFDGLPFLAEAAAGGDPALADAALESAAALAARRRHWRAPEDALEVRDGCDRMLAIAKDGAKPRLLRLKTLRVLRMLEDRGCARELPRVE